MKPRINLNQNIHLLSTTNTHVLEREQSSFTFQSFSNIRFTFNGSYQQSPMHVWPVILRHNKPLNSELCRECVRESYQTSHGDIIKQPNTSKYIRAKKKKSTRFHGNDNQTQMLLGCITFGTHPGTYTKLERSRTYFKDCFWLAGKTIGIVTKQCSHPWKQWKCRLKGTSKIRGLEQCRSTAKPRN